jgi:hypothetical protein
MSTRDALIQEILKQPEPLLRELQHYLAFLTKQDGNAIATTAPAMAWPADYFDRTAGAFAGEPLERPLQLPLENRGKW